MALFPGDQLQVIGDDDQLTRFAQAMRTEVHDEDAEIEKREMRLQQIIVGPKSPFLDQTLRESGIRDRYNCMVVGLDEGEKNLTIITPNYRFALATCCGSWARSRTSRASWRPTARSSHRPRDDDVAPHT